MKTYSKTDTGRVRETNQDSIYSKDGPLGTLPNLFAVADGMGGHRAGDFASRFAIEKLVTLVSADNRPDPNIVITDALVKTNEELYRISMSDPEKNGMGTTFVAAVIKDGILYAFNVGDSRLYIINKNIEQVTKDHSYVQEMVNNGRLREQAARIHPQKNVITRAVGVFPTLEVDCFKRALRPHDEILLCSDGLTNMLDNQRIEQLVRTGLDPVEKVERLIKAANDNGGTDNISVVYIET